MAFERLIARRILIDKDRADGTSRPIVTIAVLGIIIGMAVMILTLGITKGFQREIRTKVIGSGSHIQITSISQTDPQETPRISILQPFYPSLDTLEGVAHIQVFALRPGIVETGEEIQGVAVKGVGGDMDTSFLAAHLLKGTLLHLQDTAVYNEVLISNYIAKRLRLDIDSILTIYLVKGREDIRPRRYRVQGIFETGLEQFDHEFVFVDIRHLQRFAQWGLQAQLRVVDSCGTGAITIEAIAFGGDRVYSYRWPEDPWTGKGPHRLCVRDDTTVKVIVSDASGTLPDTAWAHFSNTSGEPCGCGDGLQTTLTTSGGSYGYYAGGFEVKLERYEDLLEVDDRIYDHLGVGLRTVNVKERFPEIFSWLELLDTNVLVIIILMIIVAIINMTSALLIIILERTNMIGVLKAMGASNWSVRKIFLIDAAYILGLGIMLGDLLGLGLSWLQLRTGWVTLPQESYYVSTVPIAIDGWGILALNLGTLLVCLLALVLPSYLVTRIPPARAIRFD